jgi:DNA modification methylase
MEILGLFPQIIEDAREIWAHTIPADFVYGAAFEDYPGVCVGGGENRLITSENLAAAKTLLGAIRAETADAFALIYMDPPFFTRTDYTAACKIRGADGTEIDIPQAAFQDTWKKSGDGQGQDGLAGYLTMMAARIMAARELLSEQGCLWLHLDFHAVHYVKVLADAIFGGAKHLINEVVWEYKSGGSSNKRFSRKHDTLLFYAKNPKSYHFMPMREKSYNRGRKPYHFKGVKEYRDEGGWYTLVNMRDVWQINMVGRTAAERTGYATQKPMELLSRIVSCCTREGDLCGDFFGGSGTLAAVSERLGRRWVSIDENPLATCYTERRLIGMGAVFESLERAWPPDARNSPSLRVRMSVSETTDPVRKRIRLQVLSYTPPMASLPASEALREAILAAGERCPMELIGGLSLDPAYDGSRFRPRFLSDGKTPLEAFFDFDPFGPDFDRAATEGKAIALRVTDIFGNAHLRILSPAEIACE